MDTPQEAQATMLPIKKKKNYYQIRKQRELEAKKLAEEARRIAQKTMKKQKTAGYCSIIPLLAKDEQFLALFKVKPDSMPTTLVNLFIDDVWSRHEKELDLTPVERKELGWILASEETKNGHLEEVKSHLSLTFFLPKACQCSVDEDASLAALRGVIQGVEDAVKAKKKKAEEEAIIRYKKQEAIQEARRIAVRNARSCKIAKYLSIFEIFLSRIRIKDPEDPTVSWIESAEEIFVALYAKYDKKGADSWKAERAREKPEERPPCGTLLWRELILHLFGSSPDSPKACLNCSSNPDISKMKDLIQARLATMTVDKHFERPLDPVEASEVKEVRAKCYERALTDLNLDLDEAVQNTIRGDQADFYQKSTVDVDPESKLNAKAYFWVIYAGDGLKALLQDYVTGRKDVEDSEPAEEEGIDFNDRAAVNRAIDRWNMDPYHGLPVPVLKDKRVEKLWTFSGPYSGRKAHLREFSWFLDTKTFGIGDKQYSWASQIREKLRRSKLYEGSYWFKRTTKDEHWQYCIRITLKELYTGNRRPDRVCGCDSDEVYGVDNDVQSEAEEVVLGGSGLTPLASEGIDTEIKKETVSANKRKRGNTDTTVKKETDVVEENPNKGLRRSKRNRK